MNLCISEDFPLIFMPKQQTTLLKEYWQSETAKLWTAATGISSQFEFQSLDDLFEEDFDLENEIIRL